VRDESPLGLGAWVWHHICFVMRSPCVLLSYFSCNSKPLHSTVSTVVVFICSDSLVCLLVHNSR
jgi:hypothetical protein